MSLGGIVYLTCLERHVLLNRSQDDQLVFRSFCGPLAPDLRGLLVAHRAEVLDFIAWRDEARAMLMRDFARIARIYTAGCVLDTAEVNAAEKELHDAFWAEDKVRFTRAVRQWRLACYRAIRGQWEGAEP